MIAPHSESILRSVGTKLRLSNHAAICRFQILTCEKMGLKEPILLCRLLLHNDISSLLSYILKSCSHGELFVLMSHAGTEKLSLKFI